MSWCEAAADRSTPTQVAVALGVEVRRPFKWV